MRRLRKRSAAMVMLGLITAASCATTPVSEKVSARDSEGASSLNSQNYSRRMFRDGSNPSLIKNAEKKASPAAKKILGQAWEMTVEDKEILRGACWDYVNAAWNRAGFPSGKRKTVFKGKKKGPYASAEDIQPGDWIYFINHSYNDVEHSALFVTWKNKKRLRAYMLAYAGERRAEPARYLEYDLRSAYQVIRAKD